MQRNRQPAAAEKTLYNIGARRKEDEDDEETMQ
jgi:hypothetical protein